MHNAAGGQEIILSLDKLAFQRQGGRKKFSQFFIARLSVTSMPHGAKGFSPFQTRRPKLFMKGPDTRVVETVNPSVVKRSESRRQASIPPCVSRNRAHFLGRWFMRCGSTCSSAPSISILISSFSVRHDAASAARSTVFTSNSPSSVVRNPELLIEEVNLDSPLVVETAASIK